MPTIMHEHPQIPGASSDRITLRPPYADDHRTEIARWHAETLDIVAHDLRNSLAVIQGNAQLIAQQVASDATPMQAKIAERLMAIETAVMQLDAQIARLGRWPNQDCARRTADLVVLARRCAAAYRQPGQYDRIRVEASAAQVLGAWDAIGLACALDNLLSNAVKYSPDGEAIAIQIRTEQDADGPWAIACVCDRGIGIPADALSKIFTPYYRAANVPPAVAGTGLGLASVRRLIAAEGGTVSVRSRVGAGSCFCIRLPLRTASAQLAMEAV